ncbi:MAG: hypothetical protein A2X56_10000 [Nitrospirae bacterium GWC2_57_13]|nr:MAG: hypothetical protein A2X56_10000 [Nitrospirae bacterium GWC2_57_13]OGW46214.1 MAG: hypothetical protein A2X57_05545 [Nitrospirae bacterium GWD2_57_8]HAR44852.1 hypothetical protein [Nitrospiraceae bacterium]HAS53571.1 hypothetical protein [Nitrospiraceae bacterium]
MAGPKRDQRVIAEFKRRMMRQIYAIGTTIFLLMMLVWKQGHPGLFIGELSRSTVVSLELLLIVGFIAFSAVNWRCPACGCYLGAGINPPRCRKCRALFQ